MSCSATQQPNISWQCEESSSILIHIQIANGSESWTRTCLFTIKFINFWQQIIDTPNGTQQANPRPCRNLIIFCSCVLIVPPNRVACSALPWSTPIRRISTADKTHYPFKPNAHCTGSGFHSMYLAVNGWADDWLTCHSSDSCPGCVCLG